MLKKRKDNNKKESHILKLLSIIPLKIKLFFALVLAIILAIYLPKIINPNGNKLTTISKASLEKVVEINDLSTLDYTYNAVAHVKDKEGNLKYHVAYDGLVTLGIDISKIDISVDEDKKEISIKLPNAEIQDISIDTSTMDYIFEKKRYETETVSQEAYKASLKDFKKRVDKQKNLLKIANNNAVTAIKALIEPWVKQFDNQYKVEVLTDEK